MCLSYFMEPASRFCLNLIRVLKCSIGPAKICILSKETQKAYQLVPESEYFRYFFYSNLKSLLENSRKSFDFSIVALLKGLSSTQSTITVELILIFSRLFSAFNQQR